MSDTGYKSPATVEDIPAETSYPWTDLANAKSSNDAWAYCSQYKTFPTNYLRSRNFSFNIPTGSTIDGIYVAIERHATDANYVHDNAVQLVYNSSRVGDNKASATKYGTSDAWAYYGGSTDKWGRTWTVAEINSATFGVDLQCCHEHADYNHYPYVDHVKLVIYYTAPAAAVAHSFGAIIG
jgi:large repetitive protein